MRASSAGGQAPGHIVIVGGGTAGWMAANLLAQRWGGAAGPCRITVLESAEVGTIGVGEGSTPFLRRFFQILGIAEQDWMPACNASYKSGIRFPGWSSVPGYEDYVHPFFNEQDRATGGEFFTNACLRRRGWAADANPQDFFIAAALARAGKAPVLPPDPQGRPQLQTDYAYHFDAALLGQFLRRHALGLGVLHRVDTVQGVQWAENGDIAGLQLQGGAQLAGDFFIDCSGFKGLLINEALGEPFISYQDNLFNDRAVAIPTALNPEVDIPSETVSRALSHGWAWQIPLSSRYGNGYVYASAFVSDDQAELELRRLLGPAAEHSEARRLKMRVGRVERHWRNNCLALGLSQGFIEPLEATALMLIQLSLFNFMELFEQAGFGRQHQGLCNERINKMFEGVRDYVVAHYQLNTRRDGDYWRANRAHHHRSERLTSILEVWDRGGDFEAELTRHGDALMYLRPSWYCLLAGMGRFPAQLRPLDRPALSGAHARAATEALVREQFPSHRQQLAALAQNMPLSAKS